MEELVEENVFPDEPALVGNNFAVKYDDHGKDMHYVKLALNSIRIKCGKTKAAKIEAWSGMRLAEIVRF